MGCSAYSGYTAAHAIAAPKFSARARLQLADGYALRDASGFVVAGRPFYSAVWERA